MKGKVEHKIVGSRMIAVAILAKMNDYRKSVRRLLNREARKGILRGLKSSILSGSWWFD